MSETTKQPPWSLWCPKCSSPEWFPGASCFACGWEGSAFDAYEEVTRKIAALEAELAEARDAAHLAHPDATKHGGIVGAIEFLRAELAEAHSEHDVPWHCENCCCPGSTREIARLRAVVDAAREVATAELQADGNGIVCLIHNDHPDAVALNAALDKEATNDE